MMLSGVFARVSLDFPPVFLIMYMVSMAHWCVEHIVNHRTIGKLSCSDVVERYGHEMCMLHGPKAMGGILGRIVIVMSYTKT